MLAARRAQGGCPSCTAQILKVYVHAIAELAPATVASRTARHLPSRTRFRDRSHDARFLTTSSRRLQDGHPANTSATSSSQPDALPDELAQLSEEEEILEELPETQDPETMVRQAKRMFGDTLPPGYLSPEEYKLYEHLYGPPLRPTSPEDVGFGSFGEAEEDPSQDGVKSVLFREDRHGNLEEVGYTMQNSTVSATNEDGQTVIIEGEEEAVEARPPSDAQLEYIEANANNQREYDALLQLQRDFEAAKIRGLQEDADLEQDFAAEEEEDEMEEEIEEDEENEQDEEDEDDPEPDARFDWYPGQEGPRRHKYTMEGEFKTSPSTLFLPKEDFVEPITELLRRTDTKHIRAAAEKSFGGPGLPNSPATPKFAKSMRQQGLGLEAGHHRMSEIDADAFIATALPGIYASVMSALFEVRKRLGPEWMRGLLNRKDGDEAGPRVLDAGAGGAGLSAWQNMVQAEWELLREQDQDLDAEPPGKRTVIVGSNQLRHRLSRFLQNTQFLPRLPNYASIENTGKQLDAPEVPQKRKVYDVIIATHLMMPLEKEWRKKEILDNLWSMLSPNGGVLIVLEKGHPRGFEAVADVRQRLLDEFILPPKPQPHHDVTDPDTTQRVREPGMIVAPCTNHFKCPMYLTPGISPGRKDFCHFSQRFVRPQFLQRVLGATHRNHEDINFSFVAVRRGVPSVTDAAETSPLSNSAEATVDSDIITPTHILQGEPATKAAFAGYESTPTSSAQRPHPLSLPRNILPPIKRKGHVTLDLCTPSGSIERWTVPKSLSKQAYHDARKARWGDLWALGAKTRVRRTVRLGRGVKEGEAVPNDGGVRAARAAALNGEDVRGRKAKKGSPKVVEIGVNERGAFAERVKGVQGRRPDRRTKGGRKPPRETNLLRLEED